MNYKRKRSPNRRAGCGLCKPQKMSHFKQDVLAHRGFGKLKQEVISKEKLQENC